LPLNNKASEVDTPFPFMKYGKRLKGSSVQYAELAVKNVNTAQDFLPGIKRMMKERRERLLNG